MAENEVQILIKAVDDATATLKKIEKQLDSTAKNSEKANQNLAQSFSKVQGAMLNLGQIAQGIHNVFEISERRTRNLENAQDRLEDSTLKLKQAQQNLADVEKNHARDSLTLEKATIANQRAQEELKVYTDRLAKGVTFTNEKLKEYEDAQIRAKEAALDLREAQGLQAEKARELSDKQDALTIANNGVERSQRSLNKVIGDAKWAYVDMGMQLLSVAGNLGTFIATLSRAAPAIGGLSTSIGGVTSAIGGAGAGGVGIGTIAAGAGLIGAIVGLAAYLQYQDYKDYQDKIAALRKEFNDLTGSRPEAELKIMDFQNSLMTGQPFSGMGDAIGQKVTIGGGAQPIGTVNFGNGGILGYLAGVQDSATNIGTTVIPQLKVNWDANFIKMAESTNRQVNDINESLDRIPNEIITYHRIITVYD
jgi:hypothetical protein